MRIRKADREALEAILSVPGDMDDLVEAVFDTVVDLILSRDWYATAVKAGDSVWLHGPFESETVAKKAMLQLVAPGPEEMTYMVRKLYKTEGNVT